MSLRVLIVAASAERRGAETEAVALCSALTARGVTCEVAALAPGANPGLDVECLGESPLALRTLLAMRRRARAADVVVAYGSSALPACAFGLVLRRTPFVYRSIGSPAAWVRGPLHRLRTAMLLHRAAHVVALWPAAEASIIELYRIKRTRLSVIPNARDGERFALATPAARDAARRGFSLSPNQPVIAIVGALSPEKRPALALEAALLVADAQVLVAGDGVERPAVEAIASGESRVRVLGNVDDVRPVYAAADVVLLASRTEGMPGVVIEAGLCGVAVVAADVGAIASMLGDVGGEVVRVDASAEEFAAAIRRVMAQRLGGAACRENALACTWHHVTPQWAALLDAIGSAGQSSR